MCVQHIYKRRRCVKSAQNTTIDTPRFVNLRKCSSNWNPLPSTDPPAANSAFFLSGWSVMPSKDAAATTRQSVRMRRAMMQQQRFEISYTGSRPSLSQFFTRGRINLQSTVSKNGAWMVGVWMVSWWGGFFGTLAFLIISLRKWFGKTSFR